MIDLAAVIAKRLDARACMLTFHRAAPSDVWQGLPNRGFYLDLGFLDDLLSSLARSRARVARIDDILAAADAGDDQPLLVNFSVDDCYRDTYEQVVPLFRRHGVPVTLFVTTGIPDATMQLGWAGLETIIMSRDVIVHAGVSRDVSTTELKRRVYAEIVAAWDGGDFDGQYAEFCRRHGVDAEALRRQHAITWEMLEALRDDPLVEIGAHTVSHPRVSALSESAAFDELKGCRERIESRLGIPCRHLAFPYGRGADCGPRDFQLAKLAGFRSASTTRKGLVGSHPDAFALPRNTVNGSVRSMAYIAATLSGATGFAAQVLGRA